MTSAHPRRSSLRQVGVPASEVPILSAQIDMVKEFIETGRQVWHAPSRGSRLLGHMASTFGTVTVGEGRVFAALVRPGTKVTEVVQTAEGETRVPCITQDQGWVIGDRIVPVDPSGEVFGGKSGVRAQFGSAVLDVVRLAAEGATPTTTRVHLSSVDGIRVVPVEDLASNVAALHGLSKPATDDRPISYAA